jgi:hypothetical protein
MSATIVPFERKPQRPETEQEEMLHLLRSIESKVDDMLASVEDMKDVRRQDRGAPGPDRGLVRQVRSTEGQGEA